MFWFLFRLLFAGFLLLYSLIISRFEYKNRLLIGYGQWFSPLKMFDDDGARIGLNDDTAQSFLLAPPPLFIFPLFVKWIECWFLYSSTWDYGVTVGFMLMEKSLAEDRVK